MRPSPLRVLYPAVLFTGTVLLCPAVAKDPAQGLSVAPAHHFQFTPEPGTAWFLESTSNGQDWHDTAGPFFGRGGTVDHFETAGDAREFRLRYVDPATVGPAPVSAGRTALQLEKDGEPVDVVFLNETEGFLRIDADHARSFTYTWVKTAPDAVEVILTGADGTFTLLRLTFIAQNLGRWGMEDIPSIESAPLVVEPLDTGGFTFRSGRFTGAPEKITLPSDLAGSGMILNEAGRQTFLKFTVDGEVEIHPAGSPALIGQFSWDPENEKSGRLHLDVPGLPPRALNLDLTGAGTGRFQEPAVQGSPSPRSGSFTLPEAQAPPDDDGCPPPDITGMAFIINDSSPCTLTFDGNGSGTQTKEVNGVLQVTTFTYSYSRTGGNSASVAVTFPGASGDLVDDYDFDFTDECGGSFRRESYTGGTRSPLFSRTGTFSPGAAARP